MRREVPVGFDVVDATGLTAGSVYPALDRLEDLGFLKSSWEHAATAQAEGRPARRYFQLTADGARVLVHDDLIATGGTALAKINAIEKLGEPARASTHDEVFWIFTNVDMAQDAKRQALGRISIDFSNGPTALMGWTVTDIKGGQIRVRLSDFAETADLDPKLFVLTDPRRKVGKP